MVVSLCQSARSRWHRERESRSVFFDIQKCQHHPLKRHELETGLPQFSPDIVQNGRRRTFPTSTSTPWPFVQGSLGVLRAPSWDPGYRVANPRRSVIWGGARAKVAKCYSLHRPVLLSSAHDVGDKPLGNSRLSSPDSVIGSGCRNPASSPNKATALSNWEKFLPRTEHIVQRPLTWRTLRED